MHHLEHLQSGEIRKSDRTSKPTERKKAYEKSLKKFSRDGEEAPKEKRTASTTNNPITHKSTPKCSAAKAKEGPSVISSRNPAQPTKIKSKSAGSSEKSQKESQVSELVKLQIEHAKLQGKVGIT